MRESDFFEHTRINKPIGTIVFSTAELENLTLKSWQRAPDQPGHSYFLFATSTTGPNGWNESFLIQSTALLPTTPDQELIKLLIQWNELISNDPSKRKRGIGIVLWGPQQETPDYFGHLPDSYHGLVELATKLKAPLEPVLQEYTEAGAQLLGGIPIVLTALRPRPLIGTNSQLEWISFNLLTSHSADTLPDKESKVFVMGHRQPLTTDFAKYLSGAETPPEAFRPIILGCGAVGSRLSLHLGKSGLTSQLLVDEATLNPHHLVRHGLHSGHLGKNKAEALQAELATLFGRSSEELGIEVLAGSAFDLLRDSQRLSARTLLIDATASSSVLNALCGFASLPSQLRVCRCEIADKGRLGILSYEGPNRNPRLDDLQIHLYALASQDTAIAQWLANHRDEIEETRGPALEEIGLGIGCSSSTMRLADEIVSLHSAQFTLRLRSSPGNNGLLQISTLQSTGGNSATRTFTIPPVRIINSSNADGWTVRISSEASERITIELKQAGVRETGGLLLGLVNKKRKTIYVTRALPASSDSSGSRSGFRRGTQNYLAIIEQFEHQTGGLLGYVGEWHSHPTGPLRPSSTDLRAAEELSRALRLTGLPVHMMIVGPSGIASYIYDESSQ
jgi:proteasome lid subunit RPN8/RPN11